MAGRYEMNFNQDFTSISALSNSGFRLFSINSDEKVEEIFAKDSQHIRLVERLFNCSLVVLVTKQKPNCLKMVHFKKKQDICNCVYPSEILCVRMNRHRLVVCLAESIHIHDIRDMKILHSIVNIAPNELGLCTLSLNSYLAYPVRSKSGELRIFNANTLKPGLTIQAHDSALSAMCFSPNGMLLATASERGTVIRVFCVKNGQRVQEFRRGVKRCVRIASLVFSTNGDFLCASSNTETVHIFKIADAALTESHSATAPSTMSEDSSSAGSTKSKDNSSPSSSTTATTPSNGGGWSDYFSKAVSSYLIPSQVCDVLAQYRAFATAVVAQPGLKHVCALSKVQKELKLLIACEDGFLYIYDFNAERGGPCKLLRVHDLRSALEGVTELKLTESMDKVSLTHVPMPNTSCATEAAKVTCSANVLIENPEPVPDHSYAGILKGDQAANAMTADSAKFRNLCDAIDTPIKLYDERQFPPVAIAAKD